MLRRRARELAHTATVERPVTWALPGETVLLTDARHGLRHRGVLAQAQETWSHTPPLGTAIYTVEVAAA